MIEKVGDGYRTLSVLWVEAWLYNPFALMTLEQNYS